MVKDVPNVVLEQIDLDEDGQYCRGITRADGLFDVAVVDGRDRVNCMKQALSKLTDRGIILFDNSQRAHYRPAIEATKGAGWRELQIAGPAPMTWVESFTSILYRPDNCFGI